MEGRVHYLKEGNEVLVGKERKDEKEALQEKGKGGEGEEEGA